MTVDNTKDLGSAIERGEEEIIIEGDLGKKIIRIKATGKVAFIIAIGAVACALVVAVSAPATGPGAPAMGVIATTSASAAVGVWGLATTVAAISLCIGTGSTIVLKKLYKEYKITKKTSKSIMLVKK